METVGSPAGNFTYTYEPSSHLIKTLTSPAHTVTNVYEPNRDVLAVKENKVGSAEISRYQYGVNSLGQRTSLAQTGSAFASARDITWGYDGLGQVTRKSNSAVRNNWDFCFVAKFNNIENGRQLWHADTCNTRR